SAIAPQLRRQLLPSKSTSATSHNQSFRKKLSRAAARCCPVELPRLAAHWVPYLAGCWPVAARNPPKSQENKSKRSRGKKRIWTQRKSRNSKKLKPLPTKPRTVLNSATKNAQPSLPA